MRLVADESCDFAVVSGARSAGHDVISITERMPGAEDEQVIKLAATERRLLLTEDKDFGQLVPAGEIRDAVFIVLWRTGLQMPPAGRKKMGDESVLRARVRAALKTGNLPDHRPEHVWGGPGSGESCAVCDRPVDKEDVELEVQFTPDQGADATNYHVHAKCFAVWELERRNEGLNGHSLPHADDGGIMLGRERTTTGQGERG